MPRSFPDMASLKHIARVHSFREPHDGENEEDYRTAVADHVQGRDMVESCEIRNKVGWDQFSEAQRFDMLARQLNKDPSPDNYATAVETTKEALASLLNELHVAELCEKANYGNFEQMTMVQDRFLPKICEKARLLHSLLEQTRDTHDCPLHNREVINRILALQTLQLMLDEDGLTTNQLYEALENIVDEDVAATVAPLFDVDDILR